MASKCGKRGRNDRQMVFCAEYLVDLNATQAAIRAGYSRKTAMQQGQRLLRNVEVRTEVGRRMERRNEQLEVNSAPGRPGSTSAARRRSGWWTASASSNS